MKIRKLLKLIALPASLIVLLISGGCDDIGIFAEIAVSEKIEEGLLPVGASPSKVIHIDGAASSYDYFSSGPRLWTRNITNRDEVSIGNKWNPIALNTSDGITWDAIQSFDASDSQALLALSRMDDKNNVLGLYYLNTNVDGSFASLEPVSGASWTGHHALKVFCPYDGADTFYVSVLNFSGEFDDDSKTFAGSELYTLVNPEGGAVWPTSQLTGGNWDISLAGRWVNGAAGDGAVTVLTAVNSTYATGVLINASDGSTVAYAGSAIACRGLTYLPYLDAFIMSGNGYSDSTYPVYVSPAATAVTVDWSQIAGGSSNPLMSFLDVTETFAGGSHVDNPNRILAGTRAEGSQEAYGYAEIDAEDADPANWVFGAYTFAQANNYLVSDLREVSVILSMPEYQFDPDDKHYVYAAASGEGLWRIDADDYPAFDGGKPRWERE